MFERLLKRVLSNQTGFDGMTDSVNQTPEDADRQLRLQAVALASHGNAICSWAPDASLWVQVYKKIPP
jgi:hypothetical protein